MMGLRLVLAVGAVSAMLIGSASAHTKPRHEYAHRHVYHAHSYHVPTHRKPHANRVYHGHGYSREHPRYSRERHRDTYDEHRTRHSYHHAYVYHRPAPPPPMPGRRPDGTYMLPGGLESVCAGGTPPPCQ